MIDSDSLVMMMMMDDAFLEMCQVETITINHRLVCLNFLDKCIRMMYPTQDFISQIRFYCSIKTLFGIWRLEKDDVKFSHS